MAKKFHDEVVTFRIKKDIKRGIRNLLKNYKDIFNDDSDFYRSAAIRFKNFIEKNPDFFDNDPIQESYNEEIIEKRRLRR